MPKTAAFIPARGGSKSIRLKNIKTINGRPLIYWTLDAAVDCDLIDVVYVSTDSGEIREVVERYGNQKIKIIGRSPESATDQSKTEVAMLEFAHAYRFETIVLIQATAPLLKAEHLQEGLQHLNEKRYDSVLSVTMQKRFIWEKNETGGIPVNYNPQNRPMRQDFNGFYVENGAFYITSKEKLLESKCRISGKIGLVFMPEETYFEVDEKQDWIIIEEFLRRKHTPKFEKNKIKALFVDCDGVLTDGGMYYSETGDELKKFNAKDGMGFGRLREAGIITGIITGEDRESVRRRAEKLMVDELHMGVKDKAKIMQEIIVKYNLNPWEIAYVGDDINDWEVMQMVGLRCSVADGVESVKQDADFVTKAKGGEGAVREVAEYILRLSAES